MSRDDFPAGSVWLVGAGPGDPDLLTRKAARLLALAEIVFHDALVGPAILDLVPRRATLVSVGKRAGRHSKYQQSIDQLLVAAARSGQRVVRLKGGDPSVFGRSNEELAALAAAGIVARVCPGVTAASAAAAAAGVSLTLRGEVRALTFVTAHARAGEPLDLDWTALAADRSGLAIYMGREAAGEIARNLIAAGRAPATPVLVAVNASLPSERIIRGELGALPFLVRSIGAKDPTLLLIGAMVARGDESKPAQDNARRGWGRGKAAGHRDPRLFGIDRGVEADSDVRVVLPHDPAVDPADVADFHRNTGAAEAALGELGAQAPGGQVPDPDAEGYRFAIDPHLREEQDLVAAARTVVVGGQQRTPSRAGRS